MMKKINRMKIYDKISFKKYFYDGLMPYEKPNSFYYRQNFEIRMGIPEDLSHSYKYNSKGFRSDEFKNIGEVHDGKHILFAGCSETEGVGNKLENIWANILYKKISEEEKCSGFFSIGSKGFSIDLIFDQFLSYVEKYGKPDVLFINFPDVFKFYVWDERIQAWISQMGVETMAAFNMFDKTYLKDLKHSIENKDSILLKDIMDENIKKISASVNKGYFLPELMSEEKYADSVINGFRYLHLMEKLCRVLEVELFWGTWDRYTSTSIENSELFKNYTNIGNAKDFYKWADKNGYTVKDIVARENFHGGIACHNYWAEKLFTAYKNKKNKK